MHGAWIANTVAVTECLRCKKGKTSFHIEFNAARMWKCGVQSPFNFWVQVRFCYWSVVFVLWIKNHSDSIYFIPVSCSSRKKLVHTSWLCCGPRRFYIYIFIEDFFLLDVKWSISTSLRVLKEYFCWSFCTLQGVEFVPSPRRLTGDFSRSLRPIC